jgi:hypothetical protein
MARDYAFPWSEFVRTISTGGRSVTVANAVIASANAIDRKTTFREDAAKSFAGRGSIDVPVSWNYLAIIGSTFLWDYRIVSEVVGGAARAGQSNPALD